MPSVPANNYLDKNFCNDLARLVKTHSVKFDVKMSNSVETIVTRPILQTFAFT